jgi:hypothetical protein
MEAMNKDQLLNIWQQNVNKSFTCQHDLISSRKLIEEVNLIVLQEPVINYFGKTIASRDWIAIYPTTHPVNPAKSRSIILLRASLCTDNWMQIDFPFGDVTAVQLTGTWGKLTIFNIYNDCDNNNTITTLSKFQHEHPDLLGKVTQGTAHVVWLGDFNRYHSHWDNHDDTRLFIKEAIKAAKVLIEATAEAELEMALPSGIPMHIHTQCIKEMDKTGSSLYLGSLIGPGNHVQHHDVKKRGKHRSPPDTNQIRSRYRTHRRHNFRDIDWNKFNKELERRLADLGPAVTIRT